MDTSSIGFQCSMFWGPVSQMKVLKVGAPHVRSKPSPLQGEAGVVSSFPMVCCWTGVWVYGETESDLLYLFQCVFSPSFSWCIGLALLVWSFPKLLFHIVIDWVCPWEKMSSGSSYIPILNQKPFFFIHISFFFLFWLDNITLDIIFFFNFSDFFLLHN